MTEIIIPNWRNSLANIVYNFPPPQRRELENVGYNSDSTPEQTPAIAVQALALMAEMYADPNLLPEERVMRTEWQDDIYDEAETDTIQSVRLFMRRDEEAEEYRGFRKPIAELSRTPFDPSHDNLDQQGITWDWFYVGDWRAEQAGMSEPDFEAKLAEEYPHLALTPLPRRSSNVRYTMRFTSQYAELLRQRLNGVTDGRTVTLGRYIDPSSGVIDTETMTFSTRAEEGQRIRVDLALLTNREQYISWLQNARRQVRGSLANEPEPTPTPRDTSASYDAFRKSLPKATDIHILSLPIQEHGTKASLRWGIEIETGAGRDLSGTPANWESKDDGSLQSAYQDIYIEPENCPEYALQHREMLTVTDNDTGDEMEIDNPDYEDPSYCSYCGHQDSSWDSDDCVELVSPILTSFHSRGLKQITDDLGDAPVTDTAGVHVHVESKHLTPDQVANLILIYDRFEPFIEASYQRNSRGYCKLRSTRELLEVVRRIRKERPSSVTRVPTGDRYVTVNLQALRDHGTIEFRAMGPVYNYDLLIRWAQFCREMVNAAANGATPRDALKVRDWDGVMDFFRKFGVEVNRAESGAVETEEVAAQAELLAV